MLIDTHCHIHEADFPLPIDEVMERAHQAGVLEYFCVGTSEESSRQAVAFADLHDEACAIIGVHPHESKDGYAEVERLAGTHPKIVGIGEIGLDYYYTHSPKEAQWRALEGQLQIALDHNYPVSFHVREAFEDFWPIFHNFPGLRGVMHSFTDNQENLDKALAAGLYVGINGISTFTKDEAQQALFAGIPLERLLLETDAPFLTPKPFRGKINEPAYVRLVAEFWAERRGVSLEEIAQATTDNARALFAQS